MSSTAVILFGRYPHPGKVKTRLALTLGDHRASAIYKACCENIFAELEKIDVEVQRFFFFADESDAASVQAWMPRSFMCLPQRGATLGERMSNAFAHLFGLGGHKCIIIGTDVPDITSRLIRQAIESLETADLVIGPSRDGGYYLLGMRRHFPALFEDISWSSDRVLAGTLGAIQQQELSYVLLPELIDIDTEEDLHSWLLSAKKSSANYPLFELTRGARLSKTLESV